MAAEPVLVDALTHILDRLPEARWDYIPVSILLQQRNARQGMPWGGWKFCFPVVRGLPELQSRLVMTWKSVLT